MLVRDHFCVASTTNTQHGTTTLAKVVIVTRTQEAILSICELMLFRRCEWWLTLVFDASESARIGSSAPRSRGPRLLLSIQLAANEVGGHSSTPKWLRPVRHHFRAARGAPWRRGWRTFGTTFPDRLNDGNRERASGRLCGFGQATQRMAWPAPRDGYSVWPLAAAGVGQLECGATEGGRRSPGERGG